MEFPKKVMTVSELSKLGFSKAWLRELSRTQNFCFRQGTAENSPILFDTEKFSKFINSQMRVRQNEIPR